MKMLRYSGLAVLVVCIAAFASGCGGGGGGGGTAEEMPPPVMECPQGQVGTYPDCMDPPPPEPTDAQKIAAARQELSTILSNAQARAGAASSAAAAIQNSPDATADQITNAISHSNDAQSALALIVSANTAATLATTPAEANTALGNARAAQGTLNTAASAIAGIQGAVQVAANQRQQREADEAALTGGSSLIKHIRDNRKVYDDVIGGLTASSIVVAATSSTNEATYPYHKGAPSTVYPKPSDADRGVLGIKITVAGTEVLSNSKSGKLTGVGRLTQGRDMTNDGGTVFVNAYTDISVDKQTKVAADQGSTEGVDARYNYVADADYLLAGIWLNDSSTPPSLGAFAYGKEALAASKSFCSFDEGNNTSTLESVCGNTNGLNTINGFMADDTDKTYTYRGGANGAYLAAGKASYFKADVSLTAEFIDEGGTGTGSIEGEITKITAGGKSIPGSIELKKYDLTDTNFPNLFEGSVAGVVAGNAYAGDWKGQFFGMRYDKKSTRETRKADPNNNVLRQVTTTYTPGAPNSVAGTFYATKQSGEGNAAFIGAFGAHR